MSEPLSANSNGLRRVTVTDKQYFLRPSDGRLSPLLIQSFETPAQQQEEVVEWTRIGEPQNLTSSVVSLTYWIWSPALIEGTDGQKCGFIPYLWVFVRWMVAWPVLMLMSCIPPRYKALQPSENDKSFYDRIPYEDPVQSPATREPPASSFPTSLEEDLLISDDGPDAEFDSRASEDIRMSADVQRLLPASGVQQEHQSDNAAADEAMLLRPRYLCFLRDSGEGGTKNEASFETKKVSEWMKSHGGTSTEYIFVSYTRMQFRVNTDAEISAYSYPDEETREKNRAAARKDRATLIRWGTKAAKSAGVSAFWLDFECLRDDDDVARSTSASDDVYRICDIVRAAHSMIIAVGPPVSARIAGLEQKYSSEAETTWLREWGSRLWTLPEIILCPNEHRVKLFAVGGPDEPKRMAKRNFAERAWVDAGTVGQLMDHYESSVYLTPLQLISLALECFSRRKTDQWVKGDVAYALMGLLRQRPQVNQNDSGFQAFARLSLANDSNHILERILCLLPSRKDAPWHELEDAWGAKLWDINPTCQIADVVDEQTVTLDGAYGATIIWDNLDPVHFSKGAVHRDRFWLCALAPPQPFIIGAVAFIWQAGFAERFFPGNFVMIPLTLSLVFLLVAAASLVAAPSAVSNAHRGNLQSTQARFFGIEGYINPGIVERHLFGFNHGRLRESATSSGFPRTQFQDDQRHQAISNFPIQDGTARQRPFTLVDTFSMTLTHFHAERPPVAVFICGKERGMQRAVLCSYDRRSNTFCRETIMRMKTLVLDRILRANKIRFALRALEREPRNSDGARIEEQEPIRRRYEGSTGDGIDPETTCERSVAKLDRIFMPFMWFVFSVSSPLFKWHGTALDTWITLVPFSVAQILACYALSRFHIWRVLPPAITLKGFAYLGLINQVKTFKLNQLMQLLMGVANGVILPTFVVLTCSWYRPREIPLRLLFWFSGFQIVPILLSLIARSIEKSYYEIFMVVQTFLMVPVASALCHVSMYAYFQVETPQRVRWIQADERLMYTTAAAANTYSSPWVAEAKWRKPKSIIVLKDPQVWIILFISFANAAWWTKPDDPYVSSSPEIYNIISAAIFAMVGITVSIYDFWKLTVMGASLVFAIIGNVIMEYMTIPPQLSLSAILLYAMVSFQGTVIPLIWTLIAVNTQEQSGRITMLCMSLVGISLGRAAYTTVFVTLKLHYPIFEIFQLVLVGILFGYFLRQNRKLAEKDAHISTTQSEGLEERLMDKGSSSFRYSY